MRALPFLLGGGGLAALAGGLVAWRKAAATKAATSDAVASGGTFAVAATGYWPYQAGLSAKERLMEGAPVDRKAPAICKTNPSDPSCAAHVLHTVEDFFAGRSDHASVSGDPQIFPYGQKILVDWFGQKLVGRVTDTGGHFTGLGKVYRSVGREPLDFCVESSKTPVPKQNVVATIVKGDTLDRPGKKVVASRFQGQTVVVGDLEMLGADPFRLGDGIKDGRGYGPYNTGYFTAKDGSECPFGPNGERLTPEHDFRCAPGGYLRGLRAPQKILPGYRWVNYAGRGEYGQRWGLIPVAATARAA